MNMPTWTDSYLELVDEKGYVPFNHDRRLGQNQYASRYIEGKHGSDNLGEGLRFSGLDKGSYHSILIHKDDLVEFHRRVQEAQQKMFRY